MKNILINFATMACGIFALYEQAQPDPNKIIMFGGFALFMIGIYRIMKRIPSKYQEEQNTENENES